MYKSDVLKLFRLIIVKNVITICKPIYFEWYLAFSIYIQTRYDGSIQDKLNLAITPAITQIFLKHVNGPKIAFIKPNKCKELKNQFINVILSSI